MSDLHEETHYQIALTNRQVLTAFVALLASLFVAFFAGVWIGGDDEPEARSRLVQVADGEVAPDEFQFFSTPNGELTENGTETGNAQPRRQTRKQRGPGDNKGRAKADPSAVESPGETPEVLRRPQPATATPAEPTSAPAAAPAAATAAAPAAATAAAPAAATNDSRVVQVHSGTDEAKARDLMQRLEAAGYPTSLSPAEIDGVRRYRVRVGPYPSLEQARLAESRIKQEFRLDTWIPPNLD